MRSRPQLASSSEPAPFDPMRGLLNPSIPWEPTERQWALLLLDETREVFFGGAAGGGKSAALLMCAAQYVDRPDYAALLLRKTFPDLNQPKALIPLSKSWWLGKGPRWNEAEHRWTFPSGAVIQFGYCETENDVYRYQGAAVSMIGVDEVTQWTEWAYRYLFSRLRRDTGASVPSRMRATGNPGGIGHEWVKRRFIDAPPVFGERFTLRSALADNPHLDRADYEASLAQLDPVTKARLLAGDWSVTAEGALIGRESLPVVEATLPQHVRRVRYWDRAASRDAGCYTVGLRMARNHDGKVWIEDVVRGQWAAGDVDGVMVSTAKADGRGVAVDWEIEPGSAGLALSASMKRSLAGFETHGTPSTGTKWVRAQPFASFARAGNVALLPGAWNTAYIDEMTTATPDMKGLVDQVDATSGAFRWITTHGSRGATVRGPSPAVADTWTGPGRYGDGYVPTRPW